jgi:HNH endonuclease
MAFSKEIKRKALINSARHCCVCHRYKGLKIEVHHIIPISNGGTNNEENAISLCFDCHADAGHYNPKHPRGTKFSPEELKLAKEKWHQAVELNHLDISVNEEWRAFQVPGSSFKLQYGIASTIENLNHCSKNWFSGNFTAILGAGAAVTKKRIDQKTLASWQIELTKYWEDNFKKGYVIIGCLRYFGGLHSDEYGAHVAIYFNDKPMDEFSLMITPENHTDHFHRIPIPGQLSDIDIWPLSTCQTIYAWPIQKHNLVKDDFQIVSVEIDENVSWDIDYVAIVCKT